MKQFTSLAFLSVLFGSISHLVEELELLGMPMIEYLHSIHTPALDFFFKYITKGGFEIFLVLIPIGCYWGNYGRKVVNKEKKKQEEVWPFCLDFIVILIHTWFLLSILKLIFTRPRPFQVNELIDIIEEVKIIEYSYPSGHASGASVCWVFLYMNYVDITKKHNIWVIMLGVVSVLLVGISRVYFAVHYPHDIVAGYAMGIFVAILFRKYHKGTTRLWICLAEIILGFSLAATLPFDMLQHHPGITFCPSFLTYMLFFTEVWSSNALPICSPLRKVNTGDVDVDLPFKKRLLRLILGIVIMFAIPFPIVYLIVKQHYLLALPYALMVFSFLLIIIPSIFPIFNLHKA